MNNFKVVYEGNGLSAVALIDVEMEDKLSFVKPEIRGIKTIEILAIDENGKVISIRDNARKFTFIQT